MTDAAILIVDDDDNNRFTLTERLKRDGFERLTVACDGVEALECLGREPFDLVLLDVMMPKLDGIGCLAAIKAQPDWQHVPVIMISAASDLERVVRCIELGAEDYLPKPFNKVLLRARVRACLEKKRLRDGERAHLATIERQRGRLDALLNAMLPASAVAELEATGGVEPQRHAEVTVLFCDVVGFTAFCDAHSPEEVLAGLQHLVECFETLSVRHGLEKIKTIGDALLATGNLLLAHPDPVAGALRCAFDLIGAARGGPARWELRCGIHVGPVVAGVVGRSKFSFDLWGDTVNVAARLAQTGSPAGVQLSEAARNRIGAAGIEAEPLGCLPIRGKGELPVFRCAPPAKGDWQPDASRNDPDGIPRVAGGPLTGHR